MQETLFSAGEDVVVRNPAVDRERVTLGEGAWVESRPRWVGGAGVLFDRLRACVPWRAERRRMYERVVDVPRLVSFYGEGDALPDGTLEQMGRVLGDIYAPELGEPFTTVGLCLYRDGADSVAWHGDTIGRGSTQDTIVAIVSLGAARRFVLRPRGGGAARRFLLEPGDLLVMGGSCQRTFEHAVPKCQATGPRISLQFRPRGVR